MQIQNQQNIKVNNLKMVMEIIKERQDGEISRADIAKLTRMSATSISRIVDTLISCGLVKEDAAINSDKVGRKGTRLKVIGDGLLTAGVSIDSDNISLCIMNFSDEMIASEAILLEDRPYDPDAIVRLIDSAFTALCAQIPYTRQEIRAVGISCIGNVDYKKGDIYFAPQFGWSHVDFGRRAAAALKKPVYMENDMKAAVTSVVRQEKKYKQEDITYLSIGMGVGSAVMFRGQIARGSNNAFGVVGHVIVQPGGRKCDCGQRGCVQTTLTRNSLMEECREAGHEITHIEQIFELYRSNTAWTVDFIHKTAFDLAMLIRNLVYMYNTNYILVGGALMVDFPELLDLAKEKLSALMHFNLYSDLKIIRIKTRNNSMTGAAFIAQKNSVDALIENVG